MLIQLYWPDCSLISDESTSSQNADAFFLECSLDEAKAQVFPRLTEEQRLESLQYYRPRPNLTMCEYGIDTTQMCFLITQNLSQIHPVSWYYPHSHMWNAYNPFQAIEKFEFKHLNELETWVPKPRCTEGDD